MKIPRFVYKENRWGTFQPKVVQARDGEVVWWCCGVVVVVVVVVVVERVVVEDIINLLYSKSVVVNS